MAAIVRTRKAFGPPGLYTSARSDKSASATFGNQPRVGQATPAQLPATSSMEPVGRAGGFPDKVIEAMTMLRQAQTFIEKNFDHVGRNFAEEARKIHYGETDKRNIYGEASKEEAETLAEEGIEVNQMPWLPSRDS
jgi:hypothetical protein